MNESADDYEHLLWHYGSALDEVYRLRALVAYECEMIGQYLEYASIPKGLRHRLEWQQARLRRAAQGLARDVILEDVSGWSRVKSSLRRVTGRQTLTRSEWESERWTT